MCAGSSGGCLNGEWPQNDCGPWLSAGAAHVDQLFPDFIRGCLLYRKFCLFDYHVILVAAAKVLVLVECALDQYYFTLCRYRF